MISTSSSIDKANIAKAKVFEESVQSDLGANMVSRWTLDEIIDTSQTSDQWGSNTGTLYGLDGLPQLRSASECATNGCFLFDGVDDYVNLGSMPKYSSYTISLWINGERGQSVGGILHSGGGSYYRWGISLEDGNIVSRISNETVFNSWSIEKYDNANYSKGWHFVVITDNKVKRTFYKNGKYFSDYLNTIINSGQNEPLYLGMGGNTGASRFTGMLDDVRIYNEALSLSHIKQNYIAGLNSMLSNQTISNEEYNERINNLSKK